MKEQQNKLARKILLTAAVAFATLGAAQAQQSIQEGTEDTLERQVPEIHGTPESSAPYDTYQGAPGTAGEERLTPRGAPSDMSRGAEGPIRSQIAASGYYEPPYRNNNRVQEGLLDTLQEMVPGVHPAPSEPTMRRGMGWRDTRD